MSLSGALRRIGGECPRYNVKATVVPCPGTDYVFLYGGFDENDTLDSTVYLYNVSTNTWHADRTHLALYREGHLATYIGDGNVLVFGGVPDDQAPSTGSDSFQTDSVMMVYSVTSRKWHAAPQALLSNAPARRSRHACCLDPNGRTLYLSGGLVEAWPVPDLYTYDMATGEWLGPVDFVARFDHLLAVHDGKLYSFGGLDGDMNHITNRITYMNLHDGSVVDVSVRDGTVPLLFGGPLPERVHHPNTFEYVWLESGVPSLRLEVALPLWGCDAATQMSVTQADLVSFSRTPLFGIADLQKVFDEDPLEYAWRHAFVAGDTLYVLGHGNDELSALSAVILVDLRALGLAAETAPSLADDMKRLFFSEEYADFDILAFRTSADKEAHGDASLDPEVVAHMHRMRVHKSVLLARWAHFRRVVDSGMYETHAGALVVPEPFHIVRALVYYLYTGSVDFSELTPALTTVDYSSLLILSNLYELPQLRSLVLLSLFKRLNSSEFHIPQDNPEATVSTMLRVWENAVVSNEDIFVTKIEDIIRNCWPVVTRSRAFIDMPKPLIVKLCQNCFDGKTPGNSPRSHRDSFDSTNSLLLSPAFLYRKEHSNSPFMKNFDDDTASLRELLAITSSFPPLQEIYDRNEDK